MASPGKPKLSRRERARQLREVWTLTRQRDSKLPLMVGGTFALIWAVCLALGFGLGGIAWGILFGVLGLVLAAMSAVLVLYRRATSAAMKEAEGQPGAAAGVLQSMRGDWQVTPAVAFNASQDLVHRVVGRAGVVLVGEGNPGRVRGLLVQERRRVSRVAAEVPVHEIVVGDGTGEVPLRKLQGHVTRLPRKLRPAQTAELKKRMRALGAAPPLPKGPLPRPGAKLPRGKIR